MRALSAFDGRERWIIEQSAPLLTLRGSSSPIVIGTKVIGGFDNGRLIATNIDEGVTEWEAMLSPPSGRSDLDRLSDVDGAIAAVGQDVYAAGYHGRVASLAAESGQILWAREISTYAGIGVDWNNVYVVGEDGELIALLRRNGGDVWRQGALIRRQPTAPVAFNTAVVVGDFDGYVHFFNNSDGAPVARVRVGKGMISGSPTVIGGRLFVQSENGDLSVFDVPQPEPPPEPEEDPDVADSGS
jgi:outer membrane protein assembly factor BamB